MENKAGKSFGLLFKSEIMMLVGLGKGGKYSNFIKNDLKESALRIIFFIH